MKYTVWIQWKQEKMFKIRNACLAACYSTNSQMFWKLFIFHGNLHRLRSTGFDKQQGGPGFKFKRENVAQALSLKGRMWPRL